MSERRERKVGAPAHRDAGEMRRAQQSHDGHEPRLVVEGGWILRAALGVLALALVCAYLSLCLLFWQGQWQLILHPTRTSARPATIDGHAYQIVHFGPDATGVAQRVGWWIPAPADAPFRHLVLLYLPSGDGSLADATKTLDAIEATGIPVFAIDWRGAGESAKVHPSEQHMREDADAAWQYLVESRHVPGNRILPYGVGVGAAIALGLSGEHAEIPVMILDGPRYDVEQTVRADPRVHLLPVGLLLRDRFALEPALRASAVPKLIITRAAQEDPRSLAAGDPKRTVAVPQFDAATFEQELRRFLSRYAPPTPEPGLQIGVQH